jgi:hypothetical protein
LAGSNPYWGANFMRKLLLIACPFLVAIATPSYAQEPPDGVAAQLQATAAPPPTAAAPPGTMNIFTAIFQAIDTPLMAAVNGTMGNDGGALSVG